MTKNKVLVITTKELAKNVPPVLNLLQELGFSTAEQTLVTPLEVTTAAEKSQRMWDKIILLLPHGVFSYMYLTKVHNLVPAWVTDAYSARMTAFHNNARVLIIPTNIVALPHILHLVKSYVTTTFEAGRHMVRLDLMAEETC